MKYKLIHRTTNQETICEKVVVDGYDYYLGEEIELRMSNLKMGEFYIEHTQIKPNRYSLFIRTDDQDTIENSWKIIATTNPSIDIPKIVDEVKEATNVFDLNGWEQRGYRLGYNKSQETHPFSEDDMMEFALFYKEHQGQTVKYWGNDLFKVWTKERIKTLYYE